MGSHRATLERATCYALDYLDRLQELPVRGGADHVSLRQRLAVTLTNQGFPACQVIEDLIRDAEPGIVSSAGGRFFAWVIGGALPSALAADWLTSTWDQNAALYSCGPAAAIVEEVAGDWLKQLLGLPPQSSIAFVSGCQMAHVTCLAAARHSLLAKRGWNVEERGLFGAPAIRIVSSEQRHGSIDRALRLLGFGSAAVESFPPDNSGTLTPDTLADALRPDGSPAIVLLQAGEINTGAYDRFRDLIPIARRYGAWVHVDGAFGLWAAASPKYRHLVDGVDQADSWATDGHKWLNVPYDCGYAMVADSEAHRASMSHRASYLTHHTEARDQIDWNPEWSRRARGFPTYAALRELGRDGVARLIESCCDHARALVEAIGNLPGAEVLCMPIINQGLVRFLDPSGTDHDRRTEEVITAIVQTGEAFFSATTWRGKRAMRVSVCNWRTTEEDVKRTLDAVSASLVSSRAS